MTPPKMSYAECFQSELCDQNAQTEDPADVKVDTENDSYTLIYADMC